MIKGVDPDPYLWLMDPDPVGPKNKQIWIPNTAARISNFLTDQDWAYP
jgi:hypothetical protein